MSNRGVRPEKLPLPPNDVGPHQVIPPPPELVVSKADGAAALDVALDVEVVLEAEKVPQEQVRQEPAPPPAPRTLPSADPKLTPEWLAVAVAEEAERIARVYRVKGQKPPSDEPKTPSPFIRKRVLLDE